MRRIPVQYIHPDAYTIGLFSNSVPTGNIVPMYASHFMNYIGSVRTTFRPIHMDSLGIAPLTTMSIQYIQVRAITLSCQACRSAQRLHCLRKCNAPGMSKSKIGRHFLHVGILKSGVDLDYAKRFEDCHCECKARRNLIRIRHKMYKIAGLGALLSAVMRRFCVVRSEGVPPACARNRVDCKKANPYQSHQKQRLFRPSTPRNDMIGSSNEGESHQRSRQNFRDLLLNVPSSSPPEPFCAESS